jgi:hypothetical protein
VLYTMYTYIYMVTFSLHLHHKLLS